MCGSHGCVAVHTSRTCTRMTFLVTGPEKQNGISHTPALTSPSTHTDDFSVKRLLVQKYHSAQSDYVRFLSAPKNSTITVSFVECVPKFGFGRLPPSSLNYRVVLSGGLGLISISDCRFSRVVCCVPGNVAHGTKK